MGTIEVATSGGEVTMTSVGMEPTPDIVILRASGDLNKLQLFI